MGFDASRRGGLLTIAVVLAREREIERYYQPHKADSGEEQYGNTHVRTHTHRAGQGTRERERESLHLSSQRERERERDYTYPALRLIQVLPGHPLTDPKDETVLSIQRRTSL